MRTKAKRDTSEAAIVAEWERLGAHSEAVNDGGLHDRLVFFNGRTFLAETKSGKRGLTKRQVETFTRLYLKGIPSFVVRTPSEAGRMLWGDLPAWKPSPAQQLAHVPKRTPKPKVFRPGYSRARTTGEMCDTPGCALSHMSTSIRCHKHA